DGVLAGASIDGVNSAVDCHQEAVIELATDDAVGSCAKVEKHVVIRLVPDKYVVAGSPLEQLRHNTPPCVARGREFGRLKLRAPCSDCVQNNRDGPHIGSAKREQSHAPIELAAPRPPMHSASDPRIPPRDSAT